MRNTLMLVPFPATDENRAVSTAQTCGLELGADMTRPDLSVSAAGRVTPHE